MRFLRGVKGCSRIDRIRNEMIRQEVQVFNLNEKIKFNRNTWQEHLERMQQYRITVKARKYKPRERRNLGRPRKM